MNASVSQNDIVFSLPYTGLRGMLIQWSQMPFRFSFFFFFSMHVWGIAEDCYIFQITFRNDRGLTRMREQWSSTYLLLAVIQLTHNDTQWQSWDFRGIAKCLMRTVTLIDELRKDAGVIFFFLTHTDACSDYGSCPQGSRLENIKQ